MPLENANGGATVTGALEVTAGKAIITASGSVTSGIRTTDVALPHRGTLRVCASTTVKLAADASAPAGEVPGLLMAMDQGAVEMSFATIQNADILLTPDFRILIGGPGSSEVKVRLGAGGDTCVDNPGADAPYVVVSSLFGDGVYRVQPGQRVMFQHGNLHEVVDQEKEPCGCPPAPAAANGNEFPLAQSEGLASMPCRTHPRVCSTAGGIAGGAGAAVGLYESGRDATNSQSTRPRVLRTAGARCTAGAQKEATRYLYQLRPLPETHLRRRMISPLAADASVVSRTIESS